jgi:hypothetical protein
MPTSADREPSLDERTLRLREKLVARALLRLEDWSPRPAELDEEELPKPLAVWEGRPPVRFPDTEYAFHAPSTSE